MAKFASRVLQIRKAHALNLARRLAVLPNASELVLSALLNIPIEDLPERTAPDDPALMPPAEVQRLADLILHQGDAPDVQRLIAMIRANEQVTGS